MLKFSLIVKRTQKMTDKSSTNRIFRCASYKTYLLLLFNRSNYLIRAPELQIRHTQHVFIKEEGKRNNKSFLDEEKPCSMAKRTMPDRAQSCLGLRYCPVKPEDVSLHWRSNKKRKSNSLFQLRSITGASVSPSKWRLEKWSQLLLHRLPVDYTIQWWCHHISVAGVFKRWAVLVIFRKTVKL